MNTMHAIQMVDLGRQYGKIKDKVDRAILEVLNSAAFIKGPDVKQFEQELADYLSVKHVIGCANGTDALQLALMALNLPEGAEVITPDFTFVATIEVVKLLGLTPVIVDVDPDTFNIDPEKIRKAISSKTKAIIPVHMFGQCADMDAIMDIAAEHNLYVIEDTAQALGADFTSKDGSVKKAGTIGHIGCTSFFPSKNLGCFGDGGAVFTNDDDLARTIRNMGNHGMKDQYSYESIGINSRLDTVQAAVLRIKLPELDGYNKARKRAADYYDDKLQNIEALQLPERNKNGTHIFHQYTLKVKDGRRDVLLNYLAEEGVPAKVYYPVPLHVQGPYSDSRFVEAELKVTDLLCEQVISLPMHSELDEDQLEFITNKIKNFFNY